MSAPPAKLSPFDYALSNTFMAKAQRRLTQWRTSQPIGKIGKSLITFGFDDFPKSAADAGAEIMDSINAPAIYYACTGLAGQTCPTGEQYQDEDLLKIAKAGHEIGAHTHSHLDCALAAPDLAMKDIDYNLTELKAMGLTQPVEHFAYPYGATNFALKQALQGKFETCRGVMPGHNTSRSDSMQLYAMELTPDDATTDRAIYAIETALSRPVWLNIFTHDVRQSPSQFGTTPASLMKVARTARDSGIPIVTPSQALAMIAPHRKGGQDV